MTKIGKEFLIFVEVQYRPKYVTQNFACTAIPLNCFRLGQATSSAISIAFTFNHNLGQQSVSDGLWITAYFDISRIVSTLSRGFWFYYGTSVERVLRLRYQSGRYQTQREYYQRQQSGNCRYVVASSHPFVNYMSHKLMKIYQ